MKHLTLFETAAAYNAATLDLPNVSLVEETMNVSYKPYVPETRVVAKFNVTDTSSPTRIISEFASNPFTDIEIDGIAQQSIIDSYTFSTKGEHTIKYTLLDQTSMGDDIFAECISLAEIIIPNGITSIGENAFGNCDILTSIVIPDSVTSIGDSAFFYCTSLTSVTIPNSVTSIGAGAFCYCTSLSSIDIPSNITRIGNAAFKGCSSLTSIASNRAQAPTISSDTFESIKANGTLTVPVGSTGYNTWMGTGNYYLGKYNWTKIEQ